MFDFRGDILMRIKQCIQHNCTEYSVHDSQLCEKHLDEHMKRCREVKKHERKMEKR